MLRINEPSIGVHLAVFTGSMVGMVPERVEIDQLRLNDLRADDANYFFSRRYRDAWAPPLRRLILRRLQAQVGRRHSYAVLKEPHGSQGADVLMSLLPRSRLIFLLRDGRDAIDSAFHAAQPGSWGASQLPGFVIRDRDAFIKDRAHAWLCRTAATQRAYNAHDPRLRMLVRYEELVSEPAPTMRSLAGWLGLEDSGIQEAVERTSFDRLAPDRRGAGQFARAARPGLWRENFNDEEKGVLETIMGSKLRELGYT